jgi:hypothetical protein
LELSRHDRTRTKQEGFRNWLDQPKAIFGGKLFRLGYNLFECYLSGPLTSCAASIDECGSIRKYIRQQVRLGQRPKTLIQMASRCRSLYSVSKSAHRKDFDG